MSATTRRSVSLLAHFAARITEGVSNLRGSRSSVSRGRTHRIDADLNGRTRRPGPGYAVRQPVRTIATPFMPTSLADIAAYRSAARLASR